MLLLISNSGEPSSEHLLTHPWLAESCPVMIHCECIRETLSTWDSYDMNMTVNKTGTYIFSSAIANCRVRKSFRDCGLFFCGCGFHVWKDAILMVLKLWIETPVLIHRYPLF